MANVAAPPKCHPVVAWALMSTGMGLGEIAKLYRDDLAALDLAVWRWRHERTIQLHNKRAARNAHAS